MNETTRKVMAAMSAKGLTRTSLENVEDVLEALAKLPADHAPDPVQLLEIARATGLRGYLHGVNATDAREMLSAFVSAVHVHARLDLAAAGDRVAELEQQLAQCVEQSGRWAGLAGACKGRMSRLLAWLRGQANAARVVGAEDERKAFVEAHNVALAIHEDRVDDKAFQLQERDLDRPAEEQGLFHKFLVYRVDGSDLPGGKHHGCLNFVLDLNHDPYAIPAIHAYAAACADTHPELAADLLEQVDGMPRAPGYVDQDPVCEHCGGSQMFNGGPCGACAPESGGE